MRQFKGKKINRLKTLRFSISDDFIVFRIPKSDPKTFTKGRLVHVGVHEPRTSDDASVSIVGSVLARFIGNSNQKNVSLRIFRLNSVFRRLWGMLIRQ